MKVYVTDHPICRKVSESFAKGCNGQLVPARTLLPGPSAFYGILRGCGELIRQCEWLQRNFWHIDLGYFRRSAHARGDFSGYYRVTKNAFQYDFEDEKSYPADRWKALNVEMRPWKRDGTTVYICPPTVTFGQFLGVDGQQWADAVSAEAARFTDRRLTVSTKDTPVRFDDAHCVVTMQSNVAVDALVNGVPVIVLGDSAAWPLSWDWQNIESPVYPEGRTQWASALAYQQFTLEEFENGTAWEILNDSG